MRMQRNSIRIRIRIRRMECTINDIRCCVCESMKSNYVSVRTVCFITSVSSQMIRYLDASGKLCFVAVPFTERMFVGMRAHGGEPRKICRPLDSIKLASDP